MNSILLIGICCWLAVTFSVEQETDDFIILLDQIFDIPEIKKEMNALGSNSDETNRDSRTHIFILNNGVIPNSIKIEKAGKVISVADIGELFMRNQNEYIEFKQFDVTELSATVILNFNAKKATTFYLVFEKPKGRWKLKEKRN